VPVILALVAALWMLAAPLPAWAQEPSLPTEQAPLLELDTADVRLDGRVLLRVRGVSSLDAATRARAIEQRIEAVAADSSISVDSLQVIETDGLLRIVAGNRPIMAVAPSDARLEQVLPATLASMHLERIRRSIGEYRADRSPAVFQRATLRTAGAALLTLLVLGTAVWGFRRIARLAEAQLQRRVRAVGIQTFEIVRAERIRSAVRALLRASAGFVFLAVGLTFLSYAL